MRRLAVLSALALALGVMALPAGAAPASADHDPAATMQAAAAELAAQGWIVRSVQTTSDHRDDQAAANPEAAAAPSPNTFHTDGRISVDTPKFSHPNGRKYYISGDAFIQHSGDEGNVWRARFDTSCLRDYGSTTRFDTPCDWYVGIFQALGFTSLSGGSTYVHGSANIPNTTCDFGSGGTSEWRYVDTVYPAKMSYQSAVWVDFKDSACTTDLHTSQNRTLGSYRAKLTGTESAATDPTRTGWK